MKRITFGGERFLSGTEPMGRWQGQDPNPTMAVLGGTGRFGAPYIRSFLHMGMQVKLLARSPVSVARRFVNAWVIPGSMIEKSAVIRAMEGVTAAFLITPVGGNDDTHIELKAAQTAIAAAKATRLPHLIHLSLLQQAVPTGVPLLDVKGEIEALIAASGIAWSSLRTGCYMDAWLQFFPRFMKMGIFLFPIRSRHKFSFTAQADVARIAARLVAQNRVLNSALDVIEPQQRTLQDVVDLYTTVLRRRLVPMGKWVLPVLKIIKPLFFRWYYPEGASRIRLFDYFNNNDWTGNPNQLAKILPDFKLTTMDAYLQKTIAIRAKGQLS